MNLSDLHVLAEEMGERGVRQVFGIPGSGSSLTLLDALEKQGIPFYLTHFEGSAALMGGAVGRLRGEAGVSISIKGPGLANMVPGLAACRLEALPVVSISEAYPPSTPASKAHKRMDHDGLLSAVSKGRRFLSREGPSFSELAAWAEAEVPGPVHLDIAESAIEEGSPTPVPKNDTVYKSDEKLQDLIATARHPVVIAGTLGLRKGLSTQLNDLSIPVFSVAAAKGVIDETLPHAGGVYTGVGLELSPEFSIVPKADLVIGIGLRHSEVLGVRAFHCKSINIDPLGERFCGGFQFDGIYPGSSEQMKALFKALGEKEWGLDELRQCVESMRQSLLSGPFMPAHVFLAVEQHFQHQARIVLDTGYFCTIGEHMWRVERPECYLASGQGRYMGVGLPMAIGAAVWDPSIPTIVFLGDGGIGMFLADIKMAIIHRLPIIVVLLSDAHLGSVRFRSIRDGLTENPVKVHQPSWLRAMEGLGVRAEQAKKETDLPEVLKSWDLSEGPLFIEIFFDPVRYLDMVRNIR